MDNEFVNEKELKKEKEIFFSNFAVISLGLIFFLITYFAQMNEINEKEELIEAFKANKELVCSSKIVSLNNGFSFDEKEKITLQMDLRYFLFQDVHWNKY